MWAARDGESNLQQRLPSAISLSVILSTATTCTAAWLAFNQLGIGVAPACIGNATGESSHWVTTEPWLDGEEDVNLWLLVGLRGSVTEGGRDVIMT